MWRERLAADTGWPLAARSAASLDAAWWSIRGCSADSASPAGATSEDRVSTFWICLFGGDCLLVPFGNLINRWLILHHSDCFDWRFLILLCVFRRMRLWGERWAKETMSKKRWRRSEMWKKKNARKVECKSNSKKNVTQRRKVELQEVEWEGIRRRLNKEKVK